MYKSQAEAVKEWLKAYRANEERIDKQLEEVRTLRARMTSVGAQKLSDMPRSPNAPRDKMENYVIRLESLELSIEHDVKIQDECKRTIEQLLLLLDNTEKFVIRYRYLYGYDWNDVMDSLYRDDKKYRQKIEAYRRRMYRTHERALEKMARGWSNHDKS